MGGPTILLGVGATKAGTTWMWDHLAAHPDCHARGIKELHYFDTLEGGSFDRQIRMHKRQDRRLADRAAAGRGDRGRIARRRADLADWLAVLQRRAEDVPAYLAYLTAGRGSRRLVLDVTPAYASLPAARLRQMAVMADDVRFVYLMRDPVARFWSHVRMIAERATPDPAAVPDAARALLDAILDGRPSLAVDRGDYAGALARLEAAVPADRRLVMFHEEVLTPPGYARLCAFLGIAPAAPDFARRVFPSAPVAMAPGQRARLAAFLAPQYAAVAARGPLPEAWRRSMEGVAA